MSYSKTFSSPIGKICVTANEDGLESVCLGGSRSRAAAKIGKIDKRAAAVVSQFERSLKAYFAGDANAFAAMPLAITGTAFQRKVLQRLRKVRPGSLVSYGELAKAAGYPGAARAVGSVCSRNVLPLVIPCHRVVAQGGSLGGYSGGLPLKRKLLSHEGVTAYSGKR